MPWQENGAIVAALVIIYGDAGLFVYSGTPAANNLLVSIVEADSTDTFGNATLAGIAQYYNGDAGWQAVQILNGGIKFYTTAVGSDESGPWVAGPSLAYDPSTGDVLISQSAFWCATDPSSAGTEEPWHTLPAPTYGSVTTARYKLLSDSHQAVVEITGYVPDTSNTDGTLIWPATTLPSAYEPANTPPRQIAYHTGTAGSETPAMQITTGGAIAIYGVDSTSVTRMDLRYVYSLD